MIECVEGWHLVRIVRLILATLVGVVLVSGCDRAPKHHVPVTRDLMNARFEEGSDHWLFAHDEHLGKAQKNGGINNSGCVVLTVASNQRFDCLLQAIMPLGASQCQASAYAKVIGTSIEAQIRLECIDPDQYDNEQSYGQLAAADSEVCPVNGEWVLLTATVAIPKKTKHIKVYAGVDGTDGVAHFDDFQVTRR